MDKLAFGGNFGAYPPFSSIPDVARAPSSVTLPIYGGDESFINMLASSHLVQ